ncbi:MAG TPA: patatin-like phospholipase family protein, partial [Blastocatellia bacterium]|nr:patatin-like phospholipase family protein [Blastocatellia bacterium]
TCAYLIRFPLLTALALIVIPVAAFWTDARSLLENLFDLSPAATMVVTIAALLAAWSVMVTARLTLTYSSDRFGVVQPRIGPLGWRHILLYGLLAAPITAGIVYETVELWDYTPHTTNLWKIAAFAPGIIIAFLLLWIADLAERRIDRAENYPDAPALMIPHKRAPRGKITPQSSASAPEIKAPGWLARRVMKIPQYSGRGYIDYEGGSQGRFALLPGHGGALALLFTFVAVYAAIGVTTSPWFSQFRTPSLAGVLLLLTMLNWGLSGTAFFLDRYRIPVLISILIVTGTISIFFPQTDSYYFIYPKVAGAEIKPQNLLAPRKGAKVILIAANGGGIQAAAWSARVLTGIEEGCRSGNDCGGRSFARSVRVVSAVSGGSVGAMYFVNAYKEGELPDNAGLEQIVKLAERSSLDGVTWGLVYSDFLRTIAPFLSKNRFFRRTDRARALEWEWQRDVDLKATLGDWKRDAVEGKRPGVIFNTTIVDNGCPLLFSSIEHDQNVSVAQVFDKLYDGYDAPVTSAVRLSATFPYITPAARAHRSDKTDWANSEYHIVDGGYYDNYGVTALVECLDNELDKPAVDVSELMVIRIHSMPVVNSPDRRLEKKRGFFYQVGAPLSALNTVRGAGQLSHGKVEFDLLQKRWRERAGRKVDIQLATFEYPNYDAPLSWHMTDKQKQALDKAWKEKYVDDPNSELSKVKKFLAR